MPPNGPAPHRGSSGRAPCNRGPGPTARALRQLPNRGTSSNRSSPQPRRPHGGLSRASMIPPEWTFRKSATLILRGIPQKVTPWEIRQFFEEYGRVVYVELDDASRGGSRSAKIRFEPPPRDTSFFKHGDCRLNIGGVSSWARIDFPNQQHEENKITTPLGNLCPASAAVRPSKLAFGVLTQPTTFLERREMGHSGGEHELTLVIDFKRKRFVVYFLPFDLKVLKYHRMDIKFGIIRSIHRMSIDGGSTALVLSLDDAPIVRQKVTDVNGGLWADRLVWGEDELWHRVVDIRPDRQGLTPISLDEEGGMDLGRWTTYWMTLTKAEEELWCSAEAHLRDWNIKTIIDAQLTRVPGNKAQLWDMLAEQSSVPQPKADEGFSWNQDLALLAPTSQVSLPFDVRYQLEVCISRGILSEYTIGREFLDKLLELSKPGSPDANRGRLVLEYAADENKKIYDPMSLFEDRAAMTYYPTNLLIPPYCALVRKVTVTPTRIYFSTPTVETTNRIVRRYKQVQDHFLRVQFTDELLDGRIRACDTDRDDELYKRVFRVLTQGIRMGKWHWKFLAFGNSQIRECGAFFFCQPEGDPQAVITCDKIRAWMGDFVHISSIAKLAARLGQCFSTTRLLHCISSPRIVEVPDVEKGKYCFTDGVGKISAVLAHFVAEDWNLDTTPSAFQFRMGGCKGVLVTWPEVRGTEVHIRPSQQKFPAQYNGLEIIRCSHFSCATLNRQTITILSCLGVPDDVFVDMLKEQVSNYDVAMTNEAKAVELLSSYIDENMTTTVIAGMVKDGFMHTNEPFFRSILQLWRSWSMRTLKEKARIIVDQGAFVLGCVDETGTLRGHSELTEGKQRVERGQLPQIFLQVPDTKDRGIYKVITGLCIVGRNPSLHPGDIRVVEAVDVPQLRHLRDVVVFPLVGDRDIPSMLSGGDLDGDDFFVIWDPKLLPVEWGHPPMNYTPPKPLIDSKASIVNSLAAFFVLFMKNDRLPLIAHAHLATADYEVEGAKHRKCLELAELHSTAVDYFKTGIPAKWNKKLDPRRFPHFMEKPRAKSYHSTSVLGKLYDMVHSEGFDNSENHRLPFDDRILKRFQLGNDLLKEARKIKSQYDIAMRRIMGQLEIRTEFEVWTAFVMSKPRVGTDYKVQEKVGREAAGLKKQFRDLCIKAAGERTPQKLHPFVAAMYRVTWEETRIALYEARHPHVLPDGTVGFRRVTARSMPLISFPWLFATELGRIALGSERHPEVKNLWMEKSSAKPKPKWVDVDIENELEAMDCTRLSNGQFIHRGEILHLFRHDDDEGGDGGDDNNIMASGSPTESEPGGVAEEGQEEPEPNEMTASAEKVRDRFPAVPSLEAPAETGSDTADGPVAVSPLPDTAQASAGQPFKSGQGDVILASPDLMSFDVEEHFSAPCLVPMQLHPPTQQQQQQQQQANTDSIYPTGSLAGAPAVEQAGGGKEQRSTRPSQQADSESVLSGSHNSWDQLRATKSDSSGELVASAGTAQAGIPTSTWQLTNPGERPASSSAGSWGCVSLVDDGASGSRMSYPLPTTRVGVPDLFGCQDEGAEEIKGDEDDEEVEYEEAVVEVVGETALERAARFG